MSVAFRRESDEEHKEPKFEVPIAPGPNLVTKNGLALIERRAADLQGEVDGQADEARRATLLRDLRYWRTRLATAQVEIASSSDEVAFGTRVTFRSDGALRVVEIVGGDEADPPEGRIAFSAPLARALMGAGVGDHVDFAGKGDAFEILEIDALD